MNRAATEAAPLAVMDTLDWDRFVDRYWDRQAVLITGLPTAPFVSDEVFQAAVLGTRPPSPEVMPVNTQFTIGRDQQEEPGDWLPAAADGGFAGYQRRLGDQLGGHQYALVVHGLHTFHMAQWQREREFYAGLWQRVGLPLTGAITTLFHGGYEHSPVGVHLDRFATFMYALSGRKRMRFWPTRPWSEPVTTKLDYQPYLASSFTAEVAPGQLLYWPSSYYHVGESALGDEPATSVNLGVPRGRHRAEYDVEDFLYDQAPGRLGAADLAPPPPEPGGLLAPVGARDRLPPALTQAVAALGEGTGPDQLRERVAALSLRRWTADGLHPPPPPDPPRPFAGDEVVRAVASIRWSECGEIRLCAANGHITRTPLPAGELAALVSRLDAGGPVHVAELGWPARALLVELESFRAVVRD